MIQSSLENSELTLPIRGMTCGNCVNHVERALSQLPGIQWVTVDLTAKQARVGYNSAQVGPQEMAAAIAKAGYEVSEASPAVLQHHARPGYLNEWRPFFFGLLGAAGLLILYLGLVSLAQGWQHAVDLLAEDTWIVGPIVAGFGVQVALYTYLKTVVHAAAWGTGALTGAGGGTSTAAMVACCAHHLIDVLPLVGLSAAATFLAEYRVPFMLVGLATNLIGIGVITYLIVDARRCALKNRVEGQPAPVSAACH